MIDSFFDKVYIVSFVENKYKLKRQLYYLDKIGFKNVEVKYSIDAEKVIVNPLNFTNKKDISVSFTHYNVIKEAYCLGYERILILEDDCIWHKDIDLIHKYILEHEQNPYDITYYSYIFATRNIDKLMDGTDKEPINIVIAGAHTWALGRKGMKFIIDNYENFPFIIDNYVIVSKDKECYHTLTYNQYNFPDYAVPIINMDMQYDLCPVALTRQQNQEQRTIYTNKMIETSFLKDILKPIKFEDYE